MADVLVVLRLFLSLYLTKRPKSLAFSSSVLAGLVRTAQKTLQSRFLGDVLYWQSEAVEQKQLVARQASRAIWERNEKLGAKDMYAFLIKL